MSIRNIDKYVYKFVKKTTWEDFVNNYVKNGIKEFRGNDNDIADGFIHMSLHKDLRDTFIRKHSEKEKEDFKIIAIDTEKVKDLRWETAKNGVVYPHAYSPLIYGDSIVWVIDMDRYQFGAHGL